MSGGLEATRGGNVHSGMRGARSNATSNVIAGGKWKLNIYNPSVSTTKLITTVRMKIFNLLRFNL